LKHKVDGIDVYLDNSPPDEFDSVLVLLRKDGQWVLVRNKLRGWEFPGGHRENRETFEETARREATEEAGADLSEVNYLGYYILPGGHRTIVTTAQARRLLPLNEQFETVEVLLVEELLDRSQMSHSDGLYEFFAQNWQS
jgi:8-oxo-dGTP diphosphatase